jgi:hypothetical protein
MLIGREGDQSTTQRDRPNSSLNLAVAWGWGAKSWRFAPKAAFGPGNTFREPWATAGMDRGRNAEAVGDSFCSVLMTVVLETKGSLSATAEASAKPSTGLTGKRTGGSEGPPRPTAVGALLHLAELSSGEKTVSLVSGVASCLYESAAPLDERGEDGLNAASRACAMVIVAATVVAECLLGDGCGIGGWGSRRQ